MAGKFRIFSYEIELLLSSIDMERNKYKYIIK